MRISVVHSTQYRYDAPVFQEPHTFRLRPRSDASQNLLRYSIDILPTPAGRSWCFDQDGNVVLEAWFHEPMEELSVVSSFEVETLRENPFDFLVTGELEARQRSALTPYLAGEPAGAVAEFAHSIGGGDALSFLWGLNGALAAEFAHTIREDGPAEDAGTTLAARSGSCRDLSVLFCAACRVRGIPARFVSGYEREAAFQTPSHMHAWAEVYLPGGGWRGYDPTGGVAVSTSHVAVAAAADPLLAAPLGGTYRGAAKAGMSYGIQMQVW
jgi:transglutaminase-like putative cysteine protease